MEPVSVLLDHMPVEFVHSELGALVPDSGSGEVPGRSSSQPDIAKILIELGFVDLSDTETAHRNQPTTHAVSIREDHAEKHPDAKCAWEGIGHQISLEEIIKVPGHGESACCEYYLTPRSRTKVR